MQRKNPIGDNNIAMVQTNPQIFDSKNERGTLPPSTLPKDKEGIGWRPRFSICLLNALSVIYAGTVRISTSLRLNNGRPPQTEFQHHFACFA